MNTFGVLLSERVTSPNRVFRTDPSECVPVMSGRCQLVSGLRRHTKPNYTVIELNVRGRVKQVLEERAWKKKKMKKKKKKKCRSRLERNCQHRAHARGNNMSFHSALSVCNCATIETEYRWVALGKGQRIFSPSNFAFRRGSRVGQAWVIRFFSLTSFLAGFSPHTEYSLTAKLMCFLCTVAVCAYWVLRATAAFI